MKVLLSWMREFAAIRGTSEQIAETLSDLGMAVEEIVPIGEGLDGIVVARVLERRKHPNADRIGIVDVDQGDGQPLQICCGAFNMNPGDLVPLATIGTRMADGREIQRSKMRGEWSNGMLCSAAELGLSSDHAGILILAHGSATPGTELRVALQITPDVLFDLDVTGNRPDALSVYGVTRDLAARQGVAILRREPKKITEVPESAATKAAVTIQAQELCGRFIGRVALDVQVGPSPDWLARRLIALGMRPINNVVDASNYVMLEHGQPSHAFDLDKVAGQHLRVRWALPGESLVTLDGQTRSLVPTDGVIADGKDTVIGIAGVMGGQSTEVSESTSRVLFEMAWWDPMAIARTSRRLNLRSEAATRFERGADALAGRGAMARLIEILAESTPLTVVAGVIDEVGEWPGVPTIPVTVARINALLGTDLDGAEMKALIEPIGFSCGDGADNFDVTVSSWRPDTTIEADVAEEVARQYGFSRIPKTVPTSPRAGGLSARQQDRRLIRRTLVGFGLTEAMPVPFLAPEDLLRAGLDSDAITVTNPLVTEESVLRTSLRPGLLKTIAYNGSHRNTGAALFEIGHVYLPTDRAAVLPDEREMLGVALAGAEAPAAVDALYAVTQALALNRLQLRSAEVEGLHPSRAALVTVGGEIAGVVGEIDPAVAEAYGVGERVAWLELNLSALLDCPHGERQFRPVSRFPSSDVDLAFVVADEVAAGDVANTLRQADLLLVSDVSLFDVYRSDQLAPGTRSLAYRIRFQAADRTLREDELAEVRQACIQAVVRSHGGTLRA